MSPPSKPRLPGPWSRAFSPLTNLDDSPSVHVDHVNVNGVLAAGPWSVQPHNGLPTIEETSENDSSADSDYVFVHSINQDVPSNSLDEGYEDILSIDGEVSEQDSSDSTSESDDMEASSRFPVVEYRFIQDADIGPAPFTKQHLITSSAKAPILGPHTAIQNPFGPDKDKWLHLAKNLSGSEINLTELAIFWLWSGYLNIERGNVEESTTISMAPTSPCAAERCPMIGPPDASYPMTNSTKPPFVGPRTFIRNSGNHMAGWILHISRFLTKEEIQIATENLRLTCDMPHGWAYRHDPDCSHGVKRTLGEESRLTDLLQRQDRAAVFLHDVIGLDFATQDQPGANVAPIWIKRASLAPLFGPFQLVDFDEDKGGQANTFDNGRYASSTSDFDADYEHPNIDREDISSASELQNHTDFSNNFGQESVSQPDVPSEKTCTTAGEETPDSTDSVLLEADGSGFGELSRGLIIHAGIDEFENTPVSEDVVDDSLSINEDSFLEQSFVVASPLYVQPPDAREPALIAREKETTVTCEQALEKAVVKVEEIVEAASEAFQNMAPITPVKAEPRYPLFGAIHNATAYVVTFIEQHVRIALPSCSVGYLMAATCPEVQNHIIRPADIMLFCSSYPERVGALFIAGLAVCPFILLPIWVLVEAGGPSRVRQMIMMVVIAGYVYLGALWATAQS
ncbi:uncharacterized protein K460DRAFT_399748 [Cucurbitaria berberidis CBS 394.84]|uniref:Uncharacterized protein n=1 Tax=Cucurbitaria berberidis CBS 394.84 TaxID=1168544 RepID=A0A9P4LC32_9PLEO|nr:uncharacterized protein K460DRAFT_399748 [Cucurbitaria berberidis CBS 394.84]KAF1849635.1 hypothetical protein K460DRAFT_399748 [Cucurbitaria berberidis CBS 394.84]